MTDRNPICYAGIGSRTITENERHDCRYLGEKLAAKGLILYSGNADGSDIAFQEGSGGRCVVMLPWPGFNTLRYQAMDATKALACLDVGDTAVGNAAVDRFHPQGRHLRSGARKLQCRNYHQVWGYNPAESSHLDSAYRAGGAVADSGSGWPPVRFVICCATPSRDGTEGGTGQAVRIALAAGIIPVYNLRVEGVDVILDRIGKQLGWAA